MGVHLWSCVTRLNSRTAILPIFFLSIRLSFFPVVSLPRFCFSTKCAPNNLICLVILIFVKKLLIVINNSSTW